jgi:hypothetical protein
MAKRSTSSRAPGKGASSRTPEPGARVDGLARFAAARAPAAIGRAKAATPSQTVGFRMPPGTASAIKAEARRRGTTISALLLEMWASYRQKR